MTVVNLKRVRKQKARAEKEKQSAENRARFGQAKSAKQMIEANRKQAADKLDRHLIPSISGEEER